MAWKKVDLLFNLWEKQRMVLWLDGNDKCGVPFEFGDPRAKALVELKRTKLHHLTCCELKPFCQNQLAHKVLNIHKLDGF